MATRSRAAAFLRLAAPRSSLSPFAAPKSRPTRSRPLSNDAKSPSRHAQFYTDYAAAMIPVALLGSAVYIGLRTWQQSLAQEKFLEEAMARVRELEDEITALRQTRSQSAGSSEHASTEPAGTQKRSGWRLW